MQGGAGLARSRQPRLKYGSLGEAGASPESNMCQRRRCRGRWRPERRQQWEEDGSLRRNRRYHPQSGFILFPPHGPLRAASLAVAVLLVCAAAVVADASAKKYYVHHKDYYHHHPPQEEEAHQGNNITDDGYGDDVTVDKLKVLNLNIWGLNWPFSQDRMHRFRALREIIALSDYDFILLQEVWFRKDYNIIRNSVPYYMTYFEAFNTCSGYFLPIECSGLTILSRHPIEYVDFRPFSTRGNFWNFDGEIFVNKGVGKVRVNWKGLKVDVFTTHLVSYTNNPNSDNTPYRYKQAKETAKYIRESDADIKLFGGDINALPMLGHRQPYAILRSVMDDALTDRFPGASFHPWFATFGNIRNTYTAQGATAPERIDYLMFYSRPGVGMATTEFVMPMFMTRNKDGRLVSISDHEALHAEFRVTRPKHAQDGGGGEGGYRGLPLKKDPLDEDVSIPIPEGEPAGLDDNQVRRRARQQWEARQRRQRQERERRQRGRRPRPRPRHRTGWPRLRLPSLSGLLG